MRTLIIIICMLALLCAAVAQDAPQAAPRTVPAAEYQKVVNEKIALEAEYTKAAADAYKWNSQAVRLNNELLEAQQWINSLRSELAKAKTDSEKVEVLVKYKLVK